ncbi:hypothetical protein ACE3MS_00040 [Paenibacillus dendritiformis]|uniref:hypothetical protein n=1 Tax=Paenibacillus dendritiformis TaxID=130049 RepID=UPI0036668BB6
MTIQLSTCSPKEFIRLLNLLKENQVTCSLEINLGNKNDPFISAAGPLQTVDFDENGGGIGIIVGGTDISLDAENQFGKHVSDSQIYLSATGIGDGPTVWIDSTSLLPKGLIDRARKERNIDEEEIIGDLSEQLFDYFNLTTPEALHVAEMLVDQLKELSRHEAGGTP